MITALKKKLKKTVCVTSWCDLNLPPVEPRSLTPGEEKAMVKGTWSLQILPAPSS